MKNILVASFVALSLAACSNLGESLSSSASSDGSTSSSSSNASGSQSAGSSKYAGGKSYTAADERQFVSQVGDRVFFGYDSSTLSGDAVKVLQAQAQWLKSKSGVKIVVEGHADERGTREYNLALGERRANSVRSFLVSQGVAQDRILVVSYGKERPAVASSDEASWAKNRRGVTVLSD